MKKIKLTQNKYALVDDIDFVELSKYKWYFDPLGYPARRLSKEDGRKLRRMHRFILSTPTGMIVDHINGDGLDNRRSNLRLATKSQNMRNRGKTKLNKSGYKGVHFETFTKSWKAQIKIENKNKNLGRFDSAKKAARAYNKAAILYHGNFARLNII